MGALAGCADFAWLGRLRPGQSRRAAAARAAARCWSSQLCARAWAVMADGNLAPPTRPDPVCLAAAGRASAGGLALLTGRSRPRAHAARAGCGGSRRGAAAARANSAGRRVGRGDRWARHGNSCWMRRLGGRTRRSPVGPVVGLGAAVVAGRGGCWLLAGRGGGVGQPPQPHAPPQQPPPPPTGAGAGVAPALPVTAIVVRSLTVSWWPSGQVVGADDSLIGLATSNWSAHSRHRYA